MKPITIVPRPLRSPKSFPPDTFIYEEQQEQGETQLISAFYRHERLLEARKLEGKKQRDIRAFFGA